MFGIALGVDFLKKHSNMKSAKKSDYDSNGVRKVQNASSGLFLQAKIGD